MKNQSLLVLWNLHGSPTSLSVSVNICFLLPNLHDSDVGVCVPAEPGEKEAPGAGQEDPGEGFGKIFPTTQASPQGQEDSEEDEDLPSNVISRKDLERGRLSRDGKATHGDGFFCC